MHLALAKPAVIWHGATLLLIPLFAAAKAHFAGKGTEAREVRSSLQMGPQLRKHKLLSFLPRDQLGWEDRACL